MLKEQQGCGEEGRQLLTFESQLPLSCLTLSKCGEVWVDTPEIRSLSFPTREEETGEQLTRKWRDFSILPSLSTPSILSVDILSLSQESVRSTLRLHFSSWLLTTCPVCAFVSCVSLFVPPCYPHHVSSTRAQSCTLSARPIFC